MVDQQASLTIAEQLAKCATDLGIETALIGAAALAAHNYVRGTNDVDLATKVDPRTALPALDVAVRALGYHTELRMPDDDDPLGGVLAVWQHVDDDGEPLDLVEVINFENPFRPRRTPAGDAIRDAVRLDPDSSLRYVRLPDLVALKLYAGATRDLADIVELLKRNPNTDLDEVRRVAGSYDAASRLESLISEARAAGA
jgi:hypothetical protein